MWETQRKEDFFGCLVFHVITAEFWWGKPERKQPLGRPRRRWKDNIKIDLHEVGCARMDWIELAQVRDRWRALVNAEMNFRVP